MSIPFAPRPDDLLEPIADALDREGRAQITNLPGGTAAVPALQEAWVFDFGDNLELHIPDRHRPNRSAGPIAEACAGPAQPGGFRLVAREPRTDEGLTALVGALARLADDRAPAPVEPASLTDLDRVLEPAASASLPTAEELAAELSLSVKGQPDAVAEVADAVVPHLHKPQPRRPLRLLLVGPSGTGKGQTHDALADALNRVADNGRDWQTVRLDGNQLQEPHAVADLLGSPAGYVGHGEGSSLIQALITSPRTLVLFDEWEKAHPDVHVAVMGMMDHGHLQLRRPVQGRWTLDCRQAILLFTTNAGAAELADRLERSDLSGHRLETLARQVLMAQGMPEWIAGRHGHIAVYRPLPAEALAEIATLEVARLAEEYELELTWVEPEVIALLLAESDASATGARAIRATVDRFIGPAFTAHRAHLDEAGAGEPGDGPAPDPRVVVAGPEPRCLPYESWISDTGLGDGEPETADDDEG